MRPRAPPAAEADAPANALVRETGRPTIVAAGARFDRRRVYRYQLWRTWDASAPLLTCILLNPSTADARRDDPTIRCCVRLAARRGYGGIIVGNLFALRARDPRRLRRAHDPIGPHNDECLRAMLRGTGDVLAAWGNGGTWQRRGACVMALVQATPRVYCLGFTRLGQPRHPLYCPLARGLQALALAR
ncbi:MAG TPA: DUF1643 domain-containing protein [Phycisphaerae bacterium]|nr:DUF1643 domain-containing protein [Phycisphaerae bacterium]